MSNTDLLNREIKAGDLIAYGISFSQSTGVAIYRVLNVDYYNNHWRIKAKQVVTCFCSVVNSKPSILQYPERAIILGPEFESLVT